MWVSCWSRMLSSGRRRTPLLLQISGRQSFTLFSHSVNTAKTFQQHWMKYLLNFLKKMFNSILNDCCLLKLPPSSLMKVFMVKKKPVTHPRKPSIDNPSSSDTEYKLEETNPLAVNMNESEMNEVAFIKRTTGTKHVCSPELNQPVCHPYEGLAGYEAGSRSGGLCSQLKCPPHPHL